jgi:O-antigen ligase
MAGFGPTGTTATFGGLPTTATGPAVVRRPVRVPDIRIGMRVALFFALMLSAARLIDVSEDGKAMFLFALLFFPAMALAALRRPVWFLLLILAYLPFGKVYSLSIGIPGANMSNLILVLAPVALATNRRQRGRSRRLGRLEWLVIAYVAVASLAVGGSIGVADSVGELLQTYRGWLAPFLFFFIARGLVREREDVDAVLRVIAWVTILVALLTWAEGIARGDRGSIEASRVPGLMRQANQMAAFLVYYGVLLLALGLRERRIRSMALYVGGFLVAARAMLFTFSRSAYLAMGGGAALVVLLHSPILMVAGAGAGAVAVVAKPSLIPSSIRDRLGETTNEGAGLEGESRTLDKSSAYRLILWRAAFKMIRERPLTGVGLGRFSQVVGSYTEVTLSKEDPNDAHNAYILIAAENGLPALFLVLLVLVALATTAARVYFRHRYRVDRTVALAFLGTWVGLVVSCMLGSRFGDECLIAYFWILSALLAVTARMPAVPQAPGLP